MKKKISDLEKELENYKSIVAGALPFLVLYDGGKYDTKETLIEAIYKARNILESKDPENKYILEMFKNWKCVENKSGGKESENGKAKEKS